MRRKIYFLLTCALLLRTSALPVAAQDAPDAAGPIYLPFVNAAGSSSAEVMLEGALEVDEEPLFDAPPKENVAADAEPQGPPPPPDPEFKEAQLEASAVDGWTTILNDGFEAVPWPFAGWSTYDVNGATNGNYYWDDDDYKPYRGSWSAWPANNALDPAFSNYPNNQRTWMIYGPFSLADAAKATMTFQYWSQTELRYDWLGWFASPNGSSFYGNWVSGDSGGWRPGVIDFANVPGYGSMLGDSSVWIGFYFYSDSNTTLKGPFIDDLFIQKFNCPSQYTAYWYNSITRTPSTQRAVTCESYPFSRNWSTTAPIWLSPDNWSLYMTARPYFATSKTWTFRALSDDGVRVWVDGVLIIDKWYDQGATETHYATRYLSAGLHNVVVEYYEHTGGAQLSVNWY